MSKGVKAAFIKTKKNIFLYIKTLVAKFFKFLKTFS